MSSTGSKIPHRSKDAFALDLIARFGRMYCGDLAPLIGMGSGATANLLKRLEAKGALVSEREPSPTSPIHSRRYYRLPGAKP